MRNGFLGSLVVLLIGTSLGLAQAPVSMPSDMVLPDGGLLAEDFIGREPCGPPGRFWGSAEYLFWVIKDSPLPVLVSSGPASSAGILGRDGTFPLFGGAEEENGVRSGGRFIVGYWLNESQTIGIDGSYFFLGSRALDFDASGTGGAGTAAVARPFFNLNSGAEDSQVVAYPGIVAGAVRVSLASQLHGAEANGLVNLLCGAEGRLDLLGGARYLELDESLDVTEDLQVFSGIPVLGGSRFVLADQFNTRNQFFGGQLGFRGTMSRGRLFADLVGKVALGCTQETVSISGSTTTTTGGVTTVQQGGLLALATNSGQFKRNVFAVVPEAGVTVGYQFTERIRASVGYSALYCSAVARPGPQIDRSLDTTRIPSNLPVGAPSGPARPAVLIQDGDFWAQGVTVRLELRF